MALIGRVFGLSLFAAGAGAGLGFVLFGRAFEGVLASFVFGCVGALIGAVAGAAREVALALRQGKDPRFEKFF